MAAGSGYRFGDFALSLDRGCLQKGGADLALRPKAFEVLRFLVERAGRLATKDELVQAVWPNVIVSDDSLAQCIRDIRKVLDDDAKAHDAELWAAVAGQGAVITSLFLVEDELSRGVLVHPFGPVIEGHCYHLVATEPNMASADVRAVRQWLKAVASP